MEQKIVKYSVLSPLAKVPAYATAGAAAADLCAALEEPLTIAPMQRVLVPTGLAIELPDAGCVVKYPDSLFPPRRKAPEKIPSASF